MTGPVRVTTTEGIVRATPVSEQRKVMFYATRDVVVAPPTGSGSTIPRTIPFVIGG